MKKVILTIAATLISTAAFADSAKVSGESRWVPVAEMNGQLVGVGGVSYEDAAIDTSAGFTRNEILAMRDGSNALAPSLFDPDGIPNSGDEFSS